MSRFGSLDQAIQFMIESTRKELLDNKPTELSSFRVVRPARDLVDKCKEKGEHHRGREEHYTKELERAEKDLRENGVNLQAYDPAKGYGNASYGAIASGAVSSAGTQFQPQIDQVKLDTVKRAKDKMLEHREKAKVFEKWHRAFAASPATEVSLTVDNVEWLGL